MTVFKASSVRILSPIQVGREGRVKNNLVSRPLFYLRVIAVRMLISFHANYQSLIPCCNAVNCIALAACAPCLPSHAGWPPLSLVGSESTQYQTWQEREDLFKRYNSSPRPRTRALVCKWVVAVFFGQTLPHSKACTGIFVLVCSEAKPEGTRLAWVIERNFEHTRTQRRRAEPLKERRKPCGPRPASPGRPVCSALVCWSWLANQE